MSWEIVIGIEVHVQLLTKSKIFSSSKNIFGAAPNENASMIDLGLPGTLPVLNHEAVVQAIRFGLAVDAKINPVSVFERKNYFYPDLPKGYQLSQLEHPIVVGGSVNAPLKNNPDNTVQLTRAHLEEDAGKSIHFSDHSGIDLNRAGTPLLEIVTDPCIYSIEEAISYLKQLHTLVQFIDICDGNMQEGSFRCDLNVSVKPAGSKTLGTRTEIKNMNSFKFIEKALQYEIDRHIDLLEEGKEILQETRLYDDKTETTRGMRSKEEANDYRYFPCPDLLPVQITQQNIEEVKSKLPELPLVKAKRYRDEYQLGHEDINRLMQDRSLVNYFEKVLSSTKAKPKLVANWVIGELSAYLNKNEVSIVNSPVNSQQLAELLDCIEEGIITGNIAKQVFQALCLEPGSAREYIGKENLAQIENTDELIEIINEIIKTSPEQVKQYLSGKDKLFGYFIGQAMKKTAGKANPNTLSELFNEAFNKLS